MYEIFEISSKYEIEQLGTKEKFWVIDQKQAAKQLFKIGREGTGENWAEKIASELAELIAGEVLELATLLNLVERRDAKPGTDDGGPAEDEKGRSVPFTEQVGSRPSLDNPYAGNDPS